MEIYLIRHGQTDWNVRGIMQGQTDIPLNAAGRSQAESLAESLKALPIKALYSSPLSRALETAQILGKVLRLTPFPLPSMKETDMGRWEGKTWAQIKASDSRAYKAWLADPFRVPHPEGESYAQVAVRAKEALLSLEERKTPAAVITHGDVMLALQALSGEKLMHDTVHGITAGLERLGLSNSCVWKFSLNDGKLKFDGPLFIDNGFTGW
ncbi:histidine phosphatase family protein [Qiania dongpingensis]|uniref:Histidine phosphatase family protein n=1 Tax=Qiania dongpingensis TaxID=2763669 RepID=A0A7G9G4D8_9FIRM|nr:histidine phosphatase family protein [Qiania dongpingensis]QNM05670.1 histidine phosphatase family protein [Qiania dongpingensis]